MRVTILKKRGKREVINRVELADLAGAIMKELGCTYDESQVGMFLWGKIPDSYADVEQLTEKVLHEARVFITPGFIFGSNGSRYIRISLCCKDNKLAEALERIKKLNK